MNALLHEAMMMGLTTILEVAQIPNTYSRKIKNYFDQQQHFDAPKQLGHVIQIPQSK